MSKRVFISYSHDSDEHKKWVKKLASYLLKNGIEVILDQWDLRAGEDIPKFVEDSIFHSDRVLLICTENYVQKANKRTGGVGLEAFVINSSLMQDLGTTKFFVIVKQSSVPVELPELLRSRLYIDFSDEDSFHSSLENLVREIFGKIDKPELGDNPFENIDGNERKTDNSTKLDLVRAYLDMGDEEGAIDVLMEVIDEGNIIQQREARELLTNITTA